VKIFKKNNTKQQDRL